MKPLLYYFLLFCLFSFVGNPAQADDRTNSPARPKIILALGGGGTRGAAHIGVLRVLQQQGIPVDAVVGTSMGSLIGGLYCAGMKLDEIEDLFYHKKLEHSFDTVPIPVRIVLIPVLLVPRLVGFHPYDGLYRGNRFASYLTHLVPLEKRQIEDLKPIFWAISTNLVDGQPYAITRGNLGRAIQASSAIPQLRKPVEMDGALLVDGGLVENLPIEHALKMNGDLIIAVDVDEKMEPVPLKAFRAIGSVARRVLNITLSRIDSYQTKLSTSITIIHPDVSGISLLSLDRNDVRRAVMAGEKAATDALPTIKKQVQDSSAKLNRTPGISQAL